MKWTDKQPTQPGWYWVRHAYQWKTTIIFMWHVLIGFDGPYIERTDGTLMKPSTSYEWAGPIPLPEEK